MLPDEQPDSAWLSIPGDWPEPKALHALSLGQSSPSELTELKDVSLGQLFVQAHGMKRRELVPVPRPSLRHEKTRAWASVGVCEQQDTTQLTSEETCGVDGEVGNGVCSLLRCVGVLPPR